MSYPKMLYKTREEQKIVKSEEEENEAKSVGWKNSWLEEPKAIKKESVIVRKDEPKKKVIKKKKKV